MRFSRSTISVSTLSCFSRAAIESPDWPPPITSTVGIAVGIACGCLAQVEPVRPAEIARIGVAARAVRRRVVPQSPSARRARSAASRPSGGCRRLSSGIRRMMPLPRPTFVSNLKMASIASVPARITLRGAARSGSTAKPLGAMLRASGGSAFRIASAAVQRLDLPAQRQHVAPVAVGMEQVLQRAVVRLRQRLLELAEPIVGGHRNVVRLVEHSALPFDRRLRGSSSAKAYTHSGGLRKVREMRMPP